jgi:Protein of unknown function
MCVGRAQPAVQYRPAIGRSGRPDLYDGDGDSHQGMTGKDVKHSQAKHHAPAKSHAPPHPAQHATELATLLGPCHRRWGRVQRGLVRFARRPRVRQVFWGTTLGFGLVVVAMLGLWWRLSSGPIEIPFATPWLTTAIKDNFGGNRTVSVGGTQIERDETGRTSLRIRDIVVRDADGTVVASAPKAEVGISGVSLFSGKVRAQSLNLVGAEMAVRIETDGKITVFAGADKRPLATASPPPGAKPADMPAPVSAGFADLAGALAWIDGLGASGLDGYDLRELGLKDGNLTVDDRRNDKHWSFTHINVSLTRPHQGGVVFRLTSENPAQPWDFSAAIRPLSDGVRALGIEARKVSVRDLLLALRLDRGDIESDLPLSASVRAEIAPDGTLRVVQGRVVAEAGSVIDRLNRNVHVDIEHAEFRFNWDSQRHVLVIPFQVHAGGNQFTMRATLEAPVEQNGVWLLNIGRDDAVIDPVILAASGDDEAFALNRAVARIRFDSVHKRVDLDQGDFSRVDTRSSHNIGVAVTGSLDYSGEPRLAFGVAGTRMPFSVMKRIWPIFAANDVRQWVEQHVSGGIVEHVVVAGNAPLVDFQNNGPPTPDDGLSVEMETSDTTLQPVPSLPPIRDADLTVRVTGRAANVSIGRGTVVVSAGRKLSVTGGVFEIADTHPKPAQTHSTFRVDGTISAAAELLGSPELRDAAGIALDPATSRGTVTALVTVDLPLAKNGPKDAAVYTISADLTNFSADKLLIGQKVEAATLHVNASREGYEAKGDVKINGTPASLDFRKVAGQSDGDLRLQANIDEAARARLGIDLGPAVVGTIPMIVTGRTGGEAGDDRLNVDADLTPVKIDNLLPGWSKPAGKPAHATYTMIKTGKSTRFDDLTIDGSGANVKGTVEFDAAKDITAANFPVFGFSDGDKVALKADRGNDGVLRVAMRGDILDGGNVVKSMLAGGEPEKSKRKPIDLDLDVKLGTVIGRNGETLRGLDLKLGRRNGRIRSFLLNAKIGSDSPLDGDMRLRARDGHQVIYFETDDAGALFRFTDMYPRMQGGRMWIAMDPLAQEQAPQQGTLFIRNFIVRGEPGLERVAGGPPGQQPGGVQFTELSCDFTKIPGRMAIRDGVLRGPLIGATIEGQIDYVRDDVHLQGTFVPFYGLNNMFGQLPLIGPFLGGSKEGLLGINYDAVGPPNAPRITVNPGSAIAPGLLRKFFPSPGSLDRNFMPPSR